VSDRPTARQQVAISRKRYETWFTTGVSYLFRRLDDLVALVTGMLLVAMTGATLLQVVMRYAFDSPLLWPEEFARWCFVWIVFLGGALVVRYGEHIRIDILREAIPRSARAPLELLTTGLTALALGILTLFGIDQAANTTVLSNNFHISKAYLFLAVPVGSVLTLVNLARRPNEGVPIWISAGVVLAAGLGAFLVSVLPLDLLSEASPTAIVLAASITLMALGMPIAYAMVLAAFLAFIAADLPSVVVVSQLTGTIFDNFILLAIPFFLLMGAFMNVGLVTRSLVTLASALVGHWRGGLGQVNILTSTMMGGLTGSSTADAAAVAKTLIPEMKRHGYNPAFACAITSASSLIPTMIPPSISFLLYASLASVSVGALFMAGIVPGLLIALALMITVAVLSRGGRYASASADRVPVRTTLRALGIATPALALPVLILGSLRGGVVTPTEAGAVAALYALALGAFVYRAVRIKHVASAISQSVRETSGVLLLIAGSAPVAWLLIIERVPQTVADGLGGIADNKIAFLLLLNLFLLVIGLPLEAGPAMIILVPILLPITTAVGIDPIHLGVIMVLNLMIGSLTPPVGVLAFVPAAIAKVPIMAAFAALVVMTLVLIGVLLILTFVPQLSLWLPQRVGF
jgi:tripartite ATP-independent transporter DctM subunit